jgi:glycosyltransferase involved in cell wall biosynthesis
MAIIALLEREGIRPSLVHAHKFTFEGLAGWYVARHFDVPLFISLRGEVETKVFRAKPMLRPMLRSIAGDAARLYFVSAWFEPMFATFVPGQTAKARRLPNIVRNISPTITITPPDQGLVSVFNLDTHKRKGLAWLLDAMVMALRAEPDCTLDIIGGGSPEAIARCAAMIAKRDLGASVRLVGALSNAELLQRLPHYRAMALPSLNETFGMVYVESLFAGIPVLFTAGTAVDGYLDGLGVAIAVPARDSAAIAAGLLELWRDAGRFRENIMRAGPALFATFDPVANVERYREDVRGVVGLG